MPSPDDQNTRPAEDVPPAEDHAPAEDSIPAGDPLGKPAEDPAVPAEDTGATTYTQ